MSEPCRLFFVDDDPNAGELFLRFCEDTAYQCSVFRDPSQALARFTESGAEVVITDLRMPLMSGIELLQRLRELDAEVPIIIVTAHASVESAIEALRLGASDFIKKPFDMEELLLLVDRTLERTRLLRENQLLKRQVRGEQVRHGLVGESGPMRRVFDIIAKLAEVRCNVIIEGESGTGKELVARAIHNAGGDAEKPFVTIDCGALSDTLLESELFGHEKGAFTGAAQARPGLFEAASGGTIFLDEVGNISEAMQIKLLRAIQEQQITRVGSVRPRNIDVRCLAASNQALDVLVAQGRFRADLYHRLNVVRITVPALRDRPEDVPALVHHFVEHFARTYQRDVQGFDAESMRRLQQQRWPGNVRELRNLVERHVALADGPELRLEEPPASPVAGPEALTADQPTLAELERRYVLQVLEQVGGSRKEAARVLGIDKSTLWRKLK